MKKKRELTKKQEEFAENVGRIGGMILGKLFTLLLYTTGLYILNYILLLGFPDFPDLAFYQIFILVFVLDWLIIILLSFKDDHSD